MMSILASPARCLKASFASQDTWRKRLREQDATGNAVRSVFMPAISSHVDDCKVRVNLARTFRDRPAGLLSRIRLMSVTNARNAALKASSIAIASSGVEACSTLNPPCCPSAALQRRQSPNRFCVRVLQSSPRLRQELLMAQCCG
jgi:hypothetical protein